MYCTASLGIAVVEDSWLPLCCVYVMCSVAHHQCHVRSELGNKYGLSLDWHTVDLFVFVLGVKVLLTVQ